MRALALQPSTSPLVRDVPGYPASQLGPQPIPRARFSCALQILWIEGAGAWDQQFLPTRQPLSHGKTSVTAGSTTCLSSPSRIPQGTTPPGAGDTPGPGRALQVRLLPR